jgi:hypothetical protein
MTEYVQVVEMAQLAHRLTTRNPNLSRPPQIPQNSANKLSSVSFKIEGSR